MGKSRKLEEKTRHCERKARLGQNIRKREERSNKEARKTGKGRSNRESRGEVRQDLGRAFSFGLFRIGVLRLRTGTGEGGKEEGGNEVTGRRQWGKHVLFKQQQPTRHGSFICATAVLRCLVVLLSPFATTYASLITLPFSLMLSLNCSAGRQGFWRIHQTEANTSALRSANPVRRKAQVREEREEETRERGRRKRWRKLRRRTDTCTHARALEPRQDGFVLVSGRVCSQG